VIRLSALVLLLLAASPAAGREALGAFGEWGAFVDSRPERSCYAISQPTASAGARGAYLTVSTWPAKGQREQVGVVAGVRYRTGSAVTARIGSASFKLFTRDDGAWTADADADVRLVTAMRRGSALVLEGQNSAGKGFVQRYSLRGIAAALDAARVACR
jgi:Invasion associated locus B (IalB) protein